jgi:hypothetical protein
VLSTSRIILLTSEDLHGDIARYELGIAACGSRSRKRSWSKTIYRVLLWPDTAEGPWTGST